MSMHYWLSNDMINLVGLPNRSIGRFAEHLEVDLAVGTVDVDRRQRELVVDLIERTPNVVGGSARIARTRVPVWTLFSHRRLGATDRQLLEAFPTLRDVDLEAAWAYVALHQDEIERDIRENDVA